MKERAEFIGDDGEIKEYTSEVIQPHGNFRMVYSTHSFFYKIKILEWEYGTKRYTYQLYAGKVIVPAKLKGYDTIHEALSEAFHRLGENDRDNYIGVHDVIRILDEIPTEWLRPILLKAFIPKFTREKILAKLQEMHLTLDDDDRKERKYDLDKLDWEAITHIIVDVIKGYKTKIGKDDTIEWLKTAERTF